MNKRECLHFDMLTELYKNIVSSDIEYITKKLICIIFKNI